VVKKIANIYAKKFGGAEMTIDISRKMNNWTQVSINNIKVTNGSIEIGIYTSANAGNFVNVDDIVLSH
jgi:hypothetical protein